MKCKIFQDIGIRVILLCILCSCAVSNMNKYFSSLKGMDLVDVAKVLGTPNRTEKIDHSVFTTWKYADCEINTTSIQKNGRSVVDSVNWTYDPLMTYCEVYYKKIQKSQK